MSSPQETPASRVLREFGIDPDAQLQNEPPSFGFRPFVPLTPEQEAAQADRAQRASEKSAMLAGLERERRDEARRHGRSRG